MTKKPLVSVIIPVYNGSNYVADAIESALGQSYPNIEIIVINDGSNDGGATDEVVARYADRIKYIKKENGGVATALNRGIQEMHGEYFSWLSHDDFYFPNKIAAQVDFLAKHDFPKVVVYSNHSNLIVEQKTSYVTKHTVRNDLEFRAKEIVAGNQIHGCSLLVPREAFDEAGVFDEKLLVAQDYDLWFRIAEKFPFRLLDEIVVTGRVHSKQVGVRLRDRVFIENDEFRLRCLQQLDNSEICAMGANNRGLGLLRLSVRMFRMACPKSHQFLREKMKLLLAERNTPMRERFALSLALRMDASHTRIVKVVRMVKQLRHKSRYRSAANGS